jgi:hypothetical protein
MATRITHFLHSNTVTGAQVLGTAFSAADVHIHDLSSGQAPIITNSRNWYGILEGIFIKLTSAGSPTTVTIRVCADAAGDEVLIPDTTATLVAGLTTSTVKSAAFSVTGNPVMAQTTLSWSE